MAVESVWVFGARALNRGGSSSLLRAPGALCKGGVLTLTFDSFKKHQNRGLCLVWELLVMTPPMQH